jgi:hypothetical protein
LKSLWCGTEFQPRDEPWLYRRSNACNPRATDEEAAPQMVEAWIHLTAARIDQTLVLRVYAKLKCSARWWITRTAITAAAECDQRTKRWRVAVGQSNRSHARTFPGGRRLPAGREFCGTDPLLRGLFHLEAGCQAIEIAERCFGRFSKCALKLLDNQADFDSAIPRFESWRPSQPNQRLRLFCEIA